MKAIVLAGGFGKRLSSVVPEIPKPMAPIRGRPFLGLLLEYLASQGIGTVTLAVGYKHEVVERFFGNQYRNVAITYSIEDHPLGTGGAMRKAMRLCDDEPTFVINGDTFVGLNYSDFRQAFNALGTSLMVALATVNNVSRYGSVVVRDGVIQGFYEKGETGTGLVNAGVYLCRRSIFDDFDLPEVFSFEQDFLQRHVGAIRPRAYITDAEFIDIGTPESYARAQALHTI